MKKQDVLDAMRNEAKSIISNYQTEKKENDYKEWLGAIKGLAAIEGIASRLFGYETEEEKEFTFYRKNFDKQFPQPKGKIDAYPILIVSIIETNPFDQNQEQTDDNRSRQGEGRNGSLLLIQMIGTGDPNRHRNQYRTESRQKWN